MRLNTSVFILEKIAAFPFHLFAPLENPFWKTVYECLFETSVMVIWRIAVDTHHDALTIRRLKNGVRKNMREHHSLGLLDAELRRIHFTRDLSLIEDRVRDLRHNYIAHFSDSWNIDPDPEMVKERMIRLSELQEACELVNSLFRLLCFGHGRGVLPIQYDPSVRRPAGAGSRPDIERILDSMARDSALLNMLERERDYWISYRKQLPERDLYELNRYRRKFGLPEG